MSPSRLIRNLKHSLKRGEEATCVAEMSSSYQLFEQAKQQMLQCPKERFVLLAVDYGDCSSYSALGPVKRAVSVMLGGYTLSLSMARKSTAEVPLRVRVRFLERLRRAPCAR